MYIHPFSTAQEFSITYSNPTRKEAQENLGVPLSSLLRGSLVYTILLFPYHDITSQNPSKPNKKLYELMSEDSCFDSTILPE